MPSQSPQSQPISKEMQEVFKLVHKHVRAYSEMETTVQVLFVVLEVFKRLNNEAVQLQPSVAGHPVFTDLFIIVKCSSVPLLLIEVKNSGTATIIQQDNKETAQVLREAQIVLNEHKLQEIPFILTNSTTWGIGEAKKLNPKFIKLTSNTTHLLHWPCNANLLPHLQELITQYPQMAKCACIAKCIAFKNLLLC